MLTFLKKYSKLLIQGVMGLTTKFIYSKHAIYRMKTRGISQKEVEITVLFPDRWYYGSQGEINAVKKFDNKTIRIAYNSLSNYIKIITAIKE